MELSAETIINIDDYIDKVMTCSLYKLLRGLSHSLGLLGLRNLFYLKGAQKDCHLNYF